MSKRELLRKANATGAKDAGMNEEKQPQTFVDVVAERKKPGRPAEEPRRQVSIYLSERQIRALRMAAAEQDKERDQTSLVRSGLDIILSLSADNYHNLKLAAEQQNTTIGQIVDQLLSDYLN